MLRTHPDTTEWVETVRDGWNVLVGAPVMIAGDEWGDLERNFVINVRGNFISCDILQEMWHFSMSFPN